MPSPRKRGTRRQDRAEHTHSEPHPTLSPRLAAGRAVQIGIQEISSRWFLRQRGRTTRRDLCARAHTKFNCQQGATTLQSLLVRCNPSRRWAARPHGPAHVAAASPGPERYPDTRQTSYSSLNAFAGKLSARLRTQQYFALVTLAERALYFSQGNLICRKSSPL